jgi:hypothetical protein
METVEKSRTKSDFPTVPTALGNPAKNAGFPHSHSDGGGLTLPGAAPCRRGTRPMIRDDSPQNIAALQQRYFLP